MHGTISMRAFHKLLHAARTAGVELAALPTIERLGIDIVDHFERRLHLDQLYSLWEEIMQCVKDPEFPLAVADEYKLADYRELGFLVLTVSTLGEAASTVAGDYRRVWIDGPTWCAQEVGDDWRIQYDAVGGPRLGVRCVTESGLAQSYRAMCLATNRRIALKRVRFRHAAPSCIRAHERYFGAPVVFGCDFSELVFPRSVLDLRVDHTGSCMRGYFEEQADRMISRIPPSRSLRAQLERFLRDAIAQGNVSLERAASHLDMPVRSLRARLTQSGSSFRKLVDEVRLTMACEKLRDSTLSVQEIAHALGFSEPSSFHRAFKRWTGVTPQGYRRRDG